MYICTLCYLRTLQLCCLQLSNSSYDVPGWLAAGKRALSERVAEALVSYDTHTAARTVGGLAGADLPIRD